jgi:transcription initiation factor IIE alpha subunit
MNQAIVAQLQKRLRGEILKLVRENHERQDPRMDDVTLAGVLERLHFDVTVNLIRTLLQDLEERGLISFYQDRDRMTGRVSIRTIQITPRGRDVLDGTVEDRSVEVIG